MSKVTPFLMFAERLEEALEFYMTFPDSRIIQSSRAGEDGPVQTADFVLGGQHFKAFTGGEYFQFSEAFSLFYDCVDQAEVDEVWDRIVDAGGKPSQCGWITDPFGLTWQVVPRRFMELVGDPDPARSKAVRDAMMKMIKLDVAELERAADEA